MSENALVLVAKAKDEISGPVTAAAASVEEQLGRIKEAVAATEKAQRAALRETNEARRQAAEEAKKFTDEEIENLERLRDAHKEISGAASNFGGFISDQLAKSNPALGIAVEVTKQLGAVVSDAAAKTYGLAKAAADAGDAAYTSSQRTGLSTEFITRMGYATEQAGTSFGAVEKGIANLAKTVNTNSDAFKRVGISVRESNGDMKSSEALFLEVADAIAKTDNPMQRLALTQEFFGKGSKELVPLLMEGREGLEKLAEQADRLGLTIDSKTAEAGDRLNDTLALMEATSDAAGRSFGNIFVPGLTAGAAGVVEFNGAAATLIESLGPGLERSANGAGVIFRELAEATAWAVRSASEYPAVITTAADTVATLTPGIGQFYHVINSTLDGLGAFAETSEEAAEAQKKLAESTRLTTEELQEQEEQLKKTEAHAKRVADAALKKIKDDYERTQKAAFKKRQTEEEKEIDAALKRAKKEQKILEETKQEEIDAKEEAADAIEMMVNENAVIINKKAEEENKKQHARDVKRADEIAKDVFAAHKKRNEQAKKELKEIQQLSASVASSIAGAFTSAFMASTSGAETFGDALGDQFGKIFGVMRGENMTGGQSAGAALSGFINVLSSVATGAKGGAGKALGFSEGGLVPQYFAEGGFVTGGEPGKDSVPAWLMPGEFVLNKEIVDSIRGASPNLSGFFANGGLVAGQQRSQKGYENTKRLWEETDPGGDNWFTNLLGEDWFQKGVFGPAAQLVGPMFDASLANAKNEHAQRFEAAKGRNPGWRFQRQDARSYGQTVLMLGGGDAGLMKLERDYQSLARERVDRNQLTQQRSGISGRQWWRG